ncbi:MAG: site-specific integrase [Candidatus Methanomethylophilaceae archaeon]|nr:site-specific integrase [Candidatus Methanomethylophilaceae archaeon]
MELARSTEDWRILVGCTIVVLGFSCGLRPQEIRQLYADGVHLNGPHSVVYVEHVKGEGSWGHARHAPVMDGAEEILEKYLTEREKKLRACKKTTRAMFTPLDRDGEFYTQQGLVGFKKDVEDALGTKFELRSARRAFGQRLINSGNRIEDVSVAMGHASTKTTEGYYARSKEGAAFQRILENSKKKRPDSRSRKPSFWWAKTL